MSERTPLLEADYGSQRVADTLGRKASGCVLSTDNCFLSDGSRKNNVEHRKVCNRIFCGGSGVGPVED
jgi:hypothetical protein